MRTCATPDSTSSRRAERVLELLLRLYPDAGCGLSFLSPYELLVATMLSAQTTDRRVNLVTQELFALANTPQAMIELEPATLEGTIRTCGLFRAKAANIVAASRALLECFGGEVPDDFEALNSLPGVGRKTASVVLSTAFGIPALAVDTHVFRVANRLGLAHGRTPEQVEAQLRAAIPREAWIRSHHQLIAHGRQVCASQKPKCLECGLSEVCDWWTSQALQKSP